MDENPCLDPAVGRVEQLRDLPMPVSDLFLETPDTDAAKELSALCRALHRPLPQAIREAGSAPWPMGIPRLKFARDAPGRSTCSSP